MKFTTAKAFAMVCIFIPFIGVAQSGRLITAFTNPVPTAFARFGSSVAAIGSDRVIIGANGNTGFNDSGAAYLFSTNGALLMTFTNPIPKTGASFGVAVAAVGNDRVLIGAMFADYGGAAYLFGTNGMLLTSFTNPSPASILRFGNSLAVFGSDRVLIGAEGYDTGMTNSGAAFLFSINGTLLATLNNPSPGNHLFGHSVAVVLEDKLVVGAPRSDPTQVNPGFAYLFSTNGTLLMTFTNPNPASFDNFGWSVAAVGSDRVIISAAFENAIGGAYLYRSNGTLLGIFASPTPVANAQFGYSIVAVDKDRLLFGEPLADDRTRAGAAYLLNTNGNPLVTFTNPTTSQYDNQYLEFGSALAVLGNDVVIIGSPSDDTSNMNTGAAYLFSIPPPLLQIRLITTNTVAVLWPSPAPGFTLQQNTNGIMAATWSNVTDTIQDDGTNRTFITDPSLGSRFFRLIRP